MNVLDLPSRFLLAIMQPMTTDTQQKKQNRIELRSGRHSRLYRYAADWMQPEAENRYAESRQPGRYSRWAQEQRIVGRWRRQCEPDAVVLDLPCGTGRFSGLVQECGHRLLRADLSYLMVAKAAQLGPNQHCLGNLCCDLAQPPLGEKSVDVVLLWRLFHHFKNTEDRTIALQQAARLARRYVILSFYNKASLTYWGNYVIRSLLRRPIKGAGAIPISELREIAEQCGMIEQEIYHFRHRLSINSAACFAVR